MNAKSMVPEAVVAHALSLSKHMSVEQVFQLMVDNCIAHIRANEVAVEQGQGMENLHQMRVGLRRLASACKLFGDCFLLPAELEQGLDALQAQLGHARDWEVMLEHTLAPLWDATPELDLLEALLREHSAAWQLDAMAVVASGDYSRLLDAVCDWSERQGWRDNWSVQSQKIALAPIARMADRIVKQRRQVLLKRVQKLRRADNQTRHRVRIAAKKVRYGSEFLQSLYRGRKVHQYLQALKGLQDGLGALNDLAVAEHLLWQLVGERPTLAACVNEVGYFLAHRVKAEKRKLPGLWKKFCNASVPRRHGDGAK
jgi:CHAD domain-containing protein